jgi:Zn-dependent M28 family amino/carboxypeptidase
MLPGSQGENSAEYILLTAHLDHLGLGEPVEGDAIHNGAYDNASGVAILIEVARALAGMAEPPKRSLVFAAVTAEEMGLLGSRYFVEHPTVPIDRIVANINLDMVLMPGPLSDIVAFGAEHSSLGDPVGRAARAYGLELAPDPIPQEVIFIRSDQFPFVRKGIPAIFMVSWFDNEDPESLERFGSWMSEFYHSPRDDMRQPMDFDAGATFARVNLLTAYLVADAPAAPVWNPGDFFGERFGVPAD